MREVRSCNKLAISGLHSSARSVSVEYSHLFEKWFAAGASSERFAGFTACRTIWCDFQSTRLGRLSRFSRDFCYPQSAGSSSCVCLRWNLRLTLYILRLEHSE